MPPTRYEPQWDVRHAGTGPRVPGRVARGAAGRAHPATDVAADCGGRLRPRRCDRDVPNRVYKASTVARDQGVQFLDSIGKNHEFLSPVGTDAFSFNAVGIPA